MRGDEQAAMLKSMIDPEHLLQAIQNARGHDAEHN